MKRGFELHKQVLAEAPIEAADATPTALRTATRSSAVSATVRPGWGLDPP